MEKKKKIVSREFKFGYHLPKIEDYDNPTNNRPDTHVVKEIITYDDKSFEPNIRYIKDFERPFWITKEIKRNHKDKKESESLENVNRYKSTESDLGKNIASRLGYKYNGIKTIRGVRDSPFVYGIDVNSVTMLNDYYKTKWKAEARPNDVCVLDIEKNILKNYISVITIAMNDKIMTFVNKELIAKEHNPKARLEEIFQKYVPDSDFKNIKNRKIIICEDELDVIVQTFKNIHEWKPDILTGWNVIDYDFKEIISVLEKNYIDPKDIFCDPSVPVKYRHFKYKEGMKVFLSEDGSTTPINVEQQWHVIECVAHFVILDSMTSHRYIRVGGKGVAGGYSLDNILKQTLGDKLMKLKFPDTTIHKGINWHYYMSEHKPLEYIIYNQWDTGSNLTLLNHNKDLSIVIQMLAGVSSYSIFNSGPKRIIDAIHFFYLENDRVLGCKPARVVDDKVLGLGNWITTLKANYIEDRGMQILEESPTRRANVRGNVYDIDQVSGYPSDGQACNISKDTCTKEIVSIEGKDQSLFMMENMNIIYGPINSISYCSNMYNMPTVPVMMEKIKEKIAA